MEPPTGRLRLVFGERHGRTFLAEQFVRAPLRILRPFELAGGRVLLQILQVGPGVMGGDRYDLDMVVESGAKVVLVQPSATKLHTMAAGVKAEQRITLRVESGGELEYYPGLTIPYRDAEFVQRTCVRLASDARFAMLERWSAGRVAHGEAFAFRRLSSQVRVACAGKPTYADRLELTPDTAPSPGIAEGFSYLAAGVWFWGESPAGPATPALLPSSLDPRATTLVHGALPENGFYLRGLSHDGLELARQLTAFVGSWRRELGRPEERLASPP